MTKPRPDFQLNKPGALIAAIPAVLGFVPEKSLVLVAVDSGEMGAVMRVDLSPELIDAVGQLGKVVSAARPDGAIAVIVDAEGAMCPMCNDEYRDLADELTDELSAHGIELLAAHVVDAVTAGGRWHCADGCGAHGRVDDPNASPLAVAAVLDGRRLYQRRDELKAIIAVTDTARTQRLAVLVRECGDLRAAAGQSDPDECGRRDVEAAIAAAARITAGGELSDTELCELACSLTDTQVRDTLYALAISADAAKAESLWVTLCRSLPDPWRIEALVLLAFCAYARGDGPLAGISLEAALRSDPTHRMADMLDTALQSGMRPEQIRDLAVTGYRLAEQLGVRLPARRSFGRAS